MDYQVYILFSDKVKRYYVGQTHDIENRLNRHNLGLEKSTKYGVPWTLVYRQKLKTRSEAVILERKIKKRGAKRFLASIS